MLHRSLCPLTTAEQTSETERANQTLFVSFVKSKLVDSIIKHSKPLPAAYVTYYDGNLDASHLHTTDYYHALPDGTTAFEKPLTDQCINAEFNLPLGYKIQRAKLIGRSKVKYGNVFGSHDDSRVLNTMVYYVEFLNGAVREYSLTVMFLPPISWMVFLNMPRQMTLLQWIINT